MMQAGAPSPALAAALAHCAGLSADERLALASQLGLSVALGAWADSGPVPPGSAPVPPASRRVPVEWMGAPGEEQVAGCPWCRRPVQVLGLPRGAEAPVPAARRAYCAVLYGAECHSYFLGALVLGWGLLQYGGAPARVLLHTPDVPGVYVAALELAGWTCQEVQYLSNVAGSLFHNWRRSRFTDVFTKLRALQLTSFDRVMLLDLDILVRDPEVAGPAADPQGLLGGDLTLEALFELRPPAAMKRGAPVPRHGAEVLYTELWSHPARRACDELPPHQQASGINAGVVLLQPDPAVFGQVEAEVTDWHHPEHYGTYMPEQEYLSRLFGTFDRWTHLSCRFNFEVDKNERVPHDFTAAHEGFRASGHAGALVLHYSGTCVKPWALLDSDMGAGGIAGLRARLAAEGPGERLAGYGDQTRLWAAMLEWLGQLEAATAALLGQGLDALALVATQTGH
mmetsp:Transcript_48844/g.139831  ORF Transcript_48844/g.139831 Transcript_48844/m.139831 type:complete len:454 (+) Transcript_48844:92-1453(+)